MMYYNLVYVCVWLLAAFSLKRFGQPSLSVYTVQVGILAAFASLKFQTGYDWPIYEAHYDAIRAGEKFYLDFEFGYEWLAQAAAGVGLSFEGFSAIISAVEVILIASTVRFFFKKYSLVVMAIMYSVPDFYLIPTFSLLRQGLAVSIFLVGIRLFYTKKRLSALICFVIACSMHYSVVGGLLMVIAMCLLPMSRTVFSIVFLVSVAFYLSSVDVLRSLVEMLVVYVNPKYMIYLERDVFNASFAYRAAFAGVSVVIFGGLYATWNLQQAVVNEDQAARQFINRLACLSLLIPLVIYGFPTLSTRYQYFFAIFLVGAAISSLQFMTYSSRVLMILIIATLTYLPFYRFLSSPLSIVYVPYQSQLIYDKENSTGQERTNDLLNQLDVLWSK